MSSTCCSLVLWARPVKDVMASCTCPQLCMLYTHINLTAFVNPRPLVNHKSVNKPEISWQARSVTVTAQNETLVWRTAYTTRGPFEAGLASIANKVKHFLHNWNALWPQISSASSRLLKDANSNLWLFQHKWTVLLCQHIQYRLAIALLFWICPWVHALKYGALFAT